MLDLDCTLVNTARAINKWLKIIHNVGPGDVPYTMETFEVKKAYSDVTFEMLKTIFMVPEFWSDIKPLDGVQKFTEELSKHFHLSIYTDRRWYNNLELQTANYLKHHNITYDELLIVKGKEKNVPCRENNVLLAIEDRLEFAIPIAEVCPVILLKWPYNENPYYDQPEGVCKNIRLASTYREVFNLLGWEGEDQSEISICEQ